jgi:hypothetical protein
MGPCIIFKKKENAPLCVVFAVLGPRFFSICYSRKMGFKGTHEKMGPCGLHHGWISHKMKRGDEREGEREENQEQIMPG